MTELNRTASAQSVSAFTVSPSSVTAAREPKARAETIAAGLPGALCELRARPDGPPLFAFATPQLEALYELPLDQLVDSARPSLARVHPDDLPDFLAAFETSARTLGPVCHEYRVRNPRGGEVWIEMRATPFREPDGSTRWHAFLTDVTARRQGIAAHEKSQADVRASLEAAGMGTWTWHRESDRLELDDVALAMSGRTFDELRDALTAQKLLTLVYPEDGPRLTHWFQRAAAGDRMVGTEFRMRLRHGGTRLVAVRGSGVFDAAGQLERITGVCKDVTSQKRLQEAEVRSQKLEALGTLAGGIAHEFNNLLFAVLGNARLIADELSPQHPAQDGLHEIEHAVERAADLVRSMQAFSRPRETRREALQVRCLVDEVLKLMRVKLPPQVDLCVRMPPGLPSIAADPSQIQPLLVSLISNAVDAIGDNRGAIEIQVERAPASDAGPNAELVPGDYIVLSVRDTGCGMSPATLERIFDPFFTTKLPGQGTGLGLSVAHRVMRNHAGTITVTSELGRGSVFRLYFPIAASAEVPAPEASAEPVSRVRSERIMVVDDEPTLVRLVTRMLRRVGYEVEGYDDAQAALAAFTASPHAFHAVVTDLTMPAMSGFELASALRALRPDVPVLMTSGDLDDDARSRADLAGIKELIPKPNTVGMLVAALDRVFQ